MAAPDNVNRRLDDAARAGWLYFIAGQTQEKSPGLLQVRAIPPMRLVSLCLAEAA